MTIFQAPEYDPRKARRRKIIVSVVVLVVIVVGVVLFIFRNYPEERVTKNFFNALVAQDFKTAYGVWIADPNWQQHPNQHSQYLFNDFYRDWGPGGDWGVIKSFHIDTATRPHDPNSGFSNGVVVVVTINERKEPAALFVDPKDKSISFSPFQVVQ
jgi:hypothetical protein